MDLLKLMDYALSWRALNLDNKIWFKFSWVYLQKISSWWVSWTDLVCPFISSSFDPRHIMNSWWWDGSGTYFIQLIVTFPPSIWVTLKELSGLCVRWFDIEEPLYHWILAGGFEPHTLHDMKYVRPTVNGCNGPCILAPCGGTKI